MTVWLVLISAEIVHGVVRGILLRPYVGDLRARQIGVFSGSVIFFAIALACVRWIGSTRASLPEDGVDITLSVSSSEPIGVTLTDYSNGLPDVPGMEIGPRSPGFMPAPYDFRDPTAVNKRFEL